MVFSFVLKDERSKLKCLELFTFCVENLYVLLMQYIKNELPVENHRAYKIVLEHVFLQNTVTMSAFRGKKD